MKRCFSCEFVRLRPRLLVGFILLVLWSLVGSSSIEAQTTPTPSDFTVAQQGEKIVVNVNEWTSNSWQLGEVVLPAPEWRIWTKVEKRLSGQTSWNWANGSAFAMTSSGSSFITTATGFQNWTNAQTTNSTGGYGQRAMTFEITPSNAPAPAAGDSFRVQVIFQWKYSNQTTWNTFWSQYQTVTWAAANTAPEFVAPLPPETVQLEVGEAYSFDLSATDAQSQVLTFSSSAAPVPHSIDSVSGLIQWTPTAAGSFVITYRVTDSGGLFDELQISFEVVEVPLDCNGPPLALNGTKPGGTLTTFYAGATHNSFGNEAPPGFTIVQEPSLGFEWGEELLTIEVEFEYTGLFAVSVTEGLAIEGITFTYSPYQNDPTPVFSHDSTGATSGAGVYWRACQDWRERQNVGGIPGGWKTGEAVMTVAFLLRRDASPAREGFSESFGLASYGSLDSGHNSSVSFSFQANGAECDCCEELQKINENLDEIAGRLDDIHYVLIQSRDIQSEIRDKLAQFVIDPEQDDDDDGVPDYLDRDREGDTESDWRPPAGENEFYAEEDAKQWLIKPGVEDPLNTLKTALMLPTIQEERFAFVHDYYAFGTHFYFVISNLPEANSPLRGPIDMVRSFVKQLLNVVVGVTLSFRLLKVLG